MIFFALLVATLLDYNVPFAYEKRLNPYVLRWTATAQRWTSQQAGWVDWAVGVGLPVIATAVIFLALSAFASVLAWVWLVVVLYVFSGYGQFKDHMSPVGMFGRVSQGVADEGNNAFDTPAAVRFVLHRVVGYWVAFIVLALLGLGPAGAVLYRLAREKATPMTQSQAGEEPAVEEQAVEEQAVEEQPVMQAVQIEANESTPPPTEWRQTLTLRTLFTPLRPWLGTGWAGCLRALWSFARQWWVRLTAQLPRGESRRRATTKAMMRSWSQAYWARWGNLSR